MPVLHIIFETHSAGLHNNVIILQVLLLPKLNINAACVIEGSCVQLYFFFKY